MFSVWRAISKENYVSVILVEGDELPNKHEESIWDYTKIFQGPERTAAKSFMKMELINNGALTSKQFTELYGAE